jgi:hypothetical protein
MLCVWVGMVATQLGHPAEDGALIVACGIINNSLNQSCFAHRTRYSSTRSEDVGYWSSTGELDGHAASASGQ